MKVLFCCESYWPSRGGVQEVIRQIAERMAAAGHDVSVATSRHPKRTSKSIAGVRIHEFNVSGNRVSGIKGEIKRYQEFICGFDGDAILIKAAQQWSFDALWSILDRVKARKVFVPCGFSGMFEPAFAQYFSEMPAILRKFDHLIFYTEKYRDIDFVKSYGIENFSIIPNGASETDFDRVRSGDLRRSLGIPEDDFLFLTVGTPVNAKGHHEVGAAFSEMEIGRRNSTLILNGSWPKTNILLLLGLFCRPQTIVRGMKLFWRKGWRAVWTHLFPKPKFVNEIRDEGASELKGRKRVLCLDLPRADVINAFLESDLFVFASKVEYSPLVLFESAAAGTPFLTVPVGNAAEILGWTGGGILCPADTDEKQYVHVSPHVLAREMEKAMQSPDLLRELGRAGHQAWREHFTWASIAKSYERVLQGEKIGSSCMAKLDDFVGN